MKKNEGANVKKSLKNGSEKLFFKIFKITDKIKILVKQSQF